ncbi:MAG TPA: glycoside hydrolase family 76 protein, partial [Solirubrobacteraceae bacterium]|nr:glycoside hydrolase family 76 protein [Solirubrobacteraceae bacterium]
MKTTLVITVRRCSPALLALCVCCLGLVCGSARADPLLPPGHGIFTGLTGGSSRAFEGEVGKHPAVEGVFVTWGRRFESAFGQASFNHSRLMLHISTAQGYGAPEQITPRAIAQGQGDRYLLSLSARIVRGGAPVYIRLFPEMDNANNAYCAFNQDGSPRGASHSPASFRAAWRRVVLILRGGPVAALDARMHALGLPPVRGTSAAALPRPRVAFLWVPQTAGTPDTPANGPQPYYPGDAYVDWVGTDFYSRFPNFSGLRRFYSEHLGKPFAFGEWALWGGDSPEWVASLFSFMATHPNVRMVLYNQGERPDGPFRLTHFPNARRAIRQRLASVRFLAFASEWAVPARARRSARIARRSSAEGSGPHSLHPRVARRASNAESQTYLQIAEVGVTRAERLWRDRRLGWYDSRLGDRARYPLATIWDVAPLFEALDAIDIAAPSAAHRAAVAAFARGAERYYDATLRPIPGFAPYPGDRGQTRVWFDDNGWWGLAFLDAYRATGIPRYLRDAQRAFAFIAAAGWNNAGGGLWWNTSHPYLAGEPLAAGSLLGGLLFELTRKPFYRNQVLEFLSWADANFLTERRLYKRTGFDPTPTPYIEGTLAEAHQALCETGITESCGRAAQLADASAARFSDRLDMGPQFDTIYLHWMLLYGNQRGDPRWRALATEMVTRA